MKKAKTSILLLLLYLISGTLYAVPKREYHFEGTLGKSIPISLTITVNENDIVVGEIVYTKQKSPKPILLVGEIDDDGKYYVREYLKNTITGYMCFIIEDKDTTDGPYITQGIWVDPKTCKNYAMKNMVSTPYDEGYDKFYQYAEPQDIVGDYYYMEWHNTMEDYVGGAAIFTKAGKNKVHFDIVVTTLGMTMATGKSSPNRPAVLLPDSYNHFVYKNVEDCGYSFEAFFYKDFVVLRTTSYTEQCFGFGASFDGVFIRETK